MILGAEIAPAHKTRLGPENHTPNKTAPDDGPLIFLEAPATMRWLALVVLVACTGLAAAGPAKPAPPAPTGSGPLNIPEFMVRSSRFSGLPSLNFQIYGDAARFSNLTARNKAAWQYASVCGFDAEDFGCNPKTDPTCGRKGALKPMWFVLHVSFSDLDLIIPQAQGLRPRRDHRQHGRRLPGPLRQARAW